MNASEPKYRRTASRVAPFALIAALSFAICGGAQAKTPMRIDRLGLADGLSQQSANAIVQDPAGFLWIGTEDGLNRYDGYTIDHIRRVRSKPDGLPDNFIADIDVDADGKLWVATDGGGIVRQGSGPQDFRPEQSAQAPGLERIRVIRFDRSGRLWIGSRDSGLAMFDPSRRVLARWQHEPANADSLAGGSIYSLLEDARGSLWVGTNAGLERLDTKTQSIEHIPLRALSASRAIQVRALSEDHAGGIWIGTDVGLIYRDVQGLQRSFRHDPSNPRSLPADNVNAVFADSAGRVWIGTTEGLALFRHQTQSFDVYRNEAADAASLPDSHVVSLFEDRGGLLWIGTKFGGVGKWNPRTWSFGHHAGGADDGMLSSNVTSFTEDRAGRLWISTFGGGVTVKDRRRGTSFVLRHDPDKPGSISDDRVMALLTDEQGIVWAGTMGGGLNRIDPQTRAATVFQHDPNNPRTLGAPGVMSLLEDANARLWVGTYGGGLSRLDRSTGLFQRYLPDPENPARLGSGRVTALAADPSGRIWVGSDGGGLHLLDPARGRFFRFKRDPHDTGSLSSDTIYALHVDKAGSVWIGTRGGGLDRVVGSPEDPRGIRFENFSEGAGLPNNTIYGIASDAQGKLWLSTNYGIARFDLKTRRVRAFHARNGLQSEEYNFGAHYRGRSGELFFGGTHGYNAFDPAELQLTYAPPPVVLTQVLQGNERVKLPDSNAPLRIGYGHDLLTFEFAALDFADPASNAFQYRLDGSKHDWVGAGNQRRVSYSSLPGGDYILRVRAANADGVWNEPGLAFRFEVEPPPWATLKAYGAYAAALALLGWSLFAQRRRRRRLEGEYTRRLEADVISRTRELADRNSELQRMNERLEAASLSDPLTGLGNRRSLGHAMPQLISKMKLSTRRSASVHPDHMILMLVDLDRLKPINDEHGHEAGDRLLAGVSAILLDCVRSTDKVVRWGGDEFVIVASPLDFDGGAGLAERIRRTIARRRFSITRSQVARTCCSIGFATYPFVADDPYLLSWEQTLNIADMALYRAKARRNTWIGWTGTRTAAGMGDLPGLIAANPAAAVSSGLVEARMCTSTNDETIEKLLNRKHS